MKVMLCIILIITLGVPLMLRAEEGSILADIHTTAWHSRDGYGKNEEKKYNQNNLGVGLRYNFSNNFQLGGGYFKNSFDRDSFYAAIGAHYDFRSRTGLFLTPSLELGGATGYDDTPIDMDLAPLVVPSVTFGYRRTGFKVSFIPETTATESNILAFSLQIKLR